MLAAAVIGAIASPSPSLAGTQVFNCIVSDTGSFRQPFTVPSGVTEIRAVLQGAHGTTPGGGASGGAGGVTALLFMTGLAALAAPLARRRKASKRRSV